MTYRFGPGALTDYYHGGTRATFMGFPIADFNDFGSVVYFSPPISAGILDLVRWVWRVKSWNVIFSETSDDYDFPSSSPDELGLIDITNFPIWRVTSDTYFGYGIVINSAGVYALQSDLFANSDDVPGVTDTVFHLSSASGNTLIFTSPDPPNRTATAVESTYWGWA